MIKLLIFLSCTPWYVLAKPNECCPNNYILDERFICFDTEYSWITQCNNGAYNKTNNFKIHHDNESLEIIGRSGSEIIPSNRYCLGRIENNEEVAMICFPSDFEEISQDNLNMVYLVNLISSGISIIFLILTLIVYILLPNLRDLQGKCIMFTLFNFLMYFVIHVIMQVIITDITGLIIFCTMETLRTFLLMTVYVWSNIVSFNVWRSIVCPRLSSNKNILLSLYNMYGWGTPVNLIMILYIWQNLNNPIKEEYTIYCWFSGYSAYFIGSITVIIIFNIIMFISMAWTLTKQRNQTANRSRRSHLYKFYLYLKLFIIMGSSWMFALLSDFYKKAFFFWIIFCLQGLMIFLLLVVFRPRVRRDLARRGFCCGTLARQWAAIPDEDIDELKSPNDNNIALNQLL